ncbi:hypothetical protein [Ligilactobacillus saerimneri]|uniref:hypothetical protein n=1 Tax=Ligilactobacillus saerimneri TaxID=228229 RepID=UPI001C1117F7|nr:hypothetical protein [Ligilactobacillus saerimneri]MBU5308867.1 hypothetical protein [Ligilactobacillus saerimneri]
MEKLELADKLLVDEYGTKYLRRDSFYDESMENEGVSLIEDRNGESVVINDKAVSRVIVLFAFSVQDARGKRYLVDSTSMDDLQTAIDHLAHRDDWLTVWRSNALTKIKAKSIEVISEIFDIFAEKPHVPSLYFKNHSN